MTLVEIKKYFHINTGSVSSTGSQERTESFVLHISLSKKMFKFSVVNVGLHKTFQNAWNRKDEKLYSGDAMLISADSFKKPESLINCT